MSRPLVRSLLPALAVSLACASAASSAPVEPSARPLPLPGGVAGPAGDVGYVTNPTGGIDAVNLENGELLWAAREEARPLMVVDRRLAAQAPVKGEPNSVRVVVLDVKDKGKRLLESDRVVFPDWVSVGLAPGRSFSSSARLHKGDLLLSWQARAFYAGGAPPPPQVVRASAKTASGVARVNLSTGRVEMLAPDKVPPEGVLRPELEKVRSQRYWTGSEWKTEPLAAGDTLSALAVEATAGGRQKMVLKRWKLSSGEPLGSVELLEGKSLWPQVALDGRHVFIHQAVSRDQLPPGEYAWRVFSLQTGEQVAKLPFRPGTTDLTVLGRRAYLAVTKPRPGRPKPGVLETPRSLTAVDLKSGETVWERPLAPQKMLPPLP